MFAIFKSGGKQYKVQSNDVLTLEKLDGEVGKVIQLDQVLALGKEGDVELGAPLVDGAKVSAEILEQKKSAKVIIFKKKRRQNYRRKKGHRQEVTVVRILDVSGKGSAAKPKVEKKEAPKAEKKEAAPKAEKKEAPKKAPAAKASEKKEAPKAEPKKTESKAKDTKKESK